MNNELETARRIANASLTYELSGGDPADTERGERIASIRAKLADDAKLLAWWKSVPSTVRQDWIGGGE